MTDKPEAWKALADELVAKLSGNTIRDMALAIQHAAARLIVAAADGKPTRPFVSKFADGIQEQINAVHDEFEGGKK